MLDYQKYEWLYDKFIDKGMNIQEIADLTVVKRRTIEKWLVEKHRLTEIYRIKNKKITDYQKQLIIAGLLGDGHIDKREEYPIYIEAHAENQKDYLYWKYDILKDICNKPPRKIDEHKTYFFDKQYDVQAQYRFTTRSIYDLKKIRSMSIPEILENINDFILSVWLLDDAYRGKYYWELCVARFNNSEKIKMLEIIKNRFNMIVFFKKDDRYIKFSHSDSMLLDKMIIDNIPNDLDIIKYKILDRKTREMV